MNKVIAKNKEHLVELIHEAIEELGPNCDLNFIDVSNVKDMLMMFAHSDFDCTNGDISQWEVPNLKSFNYVFYKSNVPRQIIARFNAKEKYKPGLHLTKDYPIRGMMYWKQQNQTPEQQQLNSLLYFFIIQNFLYCIM